MTDRERIVEEIDRLIKKFAESPSVLPVLLSIQCFIAALPAAEEVERWAVYIGDTPEYIFFAKASAEYKARMILADSVHRVFVRRADK